MLEKYTWAGDVRLVIYDAQGRVMRRLLNGRVGAGEHEVVWDGTDDYGRQVPKGVYFIRVDTSDNREVKKVVLLR